MNENKVLVLANLVGKIALQSGAETYRVEDIINRICRHYGLNAQCFVSITCIITSVRNYKGELFCSVERVPNRTTNLNIAEVYSYDKDSTVEDLEYYCKNCDFVFNLAGVNRPENDKEFMEGNFGFASTLLDTLKKFDNKATVMLSSSIQAALIGRYAESDIL